MKTKNSVTDRIKITKSGKIRRRAMALGHSRAGKRRIQMHRKQLMRSLNISDKIIRKYL